jgi:hypothetical protein
MAQQGRPPPGAQMENSPAMNRDASGLSDVARVLDRIIRQEFERRPEMQQLVADMFRSGAINGRLVEYMRQRGIQNLEQPESEPA